MFANLLRALADQFAAFCAGRRPPLWECALGGIDRTIDITRIAFRRSVNHFAVRGIVNGIFFFRERVELLAVSVMPGPQMVAAIPKEILDSKILPQIPIGRLGKPDEVAGLIIYLCSEEAAFVTGANISINGGQHMY